MFGGGYCEPLTRLRSGHWGLPATVGTATAGENLGRSLTIPVCIKQTLFHSMSDIMLLTSDTPAHADSVQYIQRANIDSH